MLNDAYFSNLLKGNCNTKRLKFAIVLQQRMEVMKVKIVYIALFICSLAGALPGYAQLVQPARLELEIKDSEEYFSVVSAEEEGVILYRMDVEKSRGLKDVYEILLYDVDLQERWSTTIEVESAFLVGYEYKGGQFYFLFRETGSDADNFQVYAINVETSLVSGYTIKNEIPVELTEFTTVDKVMLLGGYVDHRPTVLYFDLKEEKFRVIPGLYLSRSDLLEIKTNPVNKTFTILHTERQRNRQQTISSKTYDRNASLLFDYQLEPEAGKNLIYGRTTSFGDDALHIAGTYSHGNTKYSRGVFIANLYPNGEQDINYYNYGDLDNFFSYMRAKREKRVKKRIERRKVRGKKVKLNYKLLVHDVVEKGGSNILLGEAFYPKYSSGYSFIPTPTASNFSRYNSRYHSQGTSNLEGYRYTHAVLIGFDEKGELLWDNSFEINEVLSPNLQKFVHVLPHDSLTVLLYMYENVVHSKIISKNQVLEGESTEEIATLYENDEVRYNDFDMGGLEDWYDDYLFAYGVQRIRNGSVQNHTVDANRKVFFINKLTYQVPDSLNREASRKPTN